MPRIARVVIPGMPHHVTQRACRELRRTGNRRADVFFCDSDRRRYLTLLAEDGEETAALRLRTRTPRPWGPVEFVKRLESKLGRTLLPGKRGPKPGKKRRPSPAPKER